MELMPRGSDVPPWVFPWGVHYRVVRFVTGRPKDRVITRLTLLDLRTCFVLLWDEGGNVISVIG